MATIRVNLHKFRLYSDGNRYYVDCNYWDQGYVNPGRECIEIDAAASFALTTLPVRLIDTTRVDTEVFDLTTATAIGNARTKLLIDTASFTFNTFNTSIDVRIIVDARAFNLVTYSPGIDFEINMETRAFDLATYGFLVNDIVGVETKAFAFTTLDYFLNERLRPDATSFTLTTQQPNINESVRPDTHTFNLTTNDPALDEIFNVDAASFSLTTNDVVINEEFDVVLALRGFSLTTDVLDVNEREVILVDAASFSLTTQQPNINVKVNVDAASFTLTTNDPVIDEIFNVDAASFTLTTQQPSIDESVIPDAATFTLSTQEATINDAEVVFVDAATFSLTTISVTDFILVDAAVFTLTTNDYGLDESVIPDPATFTLLPNGVGINAEELISVDAASFTLTAFSTNDIISVRYKQFDINKFPVRITDTVNIELVSFTLTTNNVIIDEIIGIDLLEFNLNPLAVQALGYLDIRDQTEGTFASPVTLPNHEAGDLVIAFVAIPASSATATWFTIVESGWEHNPNNIIYPTSPSEYSGGGGGFGADQGFATIVVWKKATGTNSETLDIDLVSGRRTGDARFKAFSVIGGFVVSSDSLIPDEGIVPNPYQGMLPFEINTPSPDEEEKRSAQIVQPGVTGTDERYINVVFLPSFFDTAFGNTYEVLDYPFVNADEEGYIITQQANSIDVLYSSSTDISPRPSSPYDPPNNSNLYGGYYRFNNSANFTVQPSGFFVTRVWNGISLTIGSNVINVDRKELSFKTQTLQIPGEELIYVDTGDFSLTAIDAAGVFERPLTVDVVDNTTGAFPSYAPGDYILAISVAGPNESGLTSNGWDHWYSDGDDAVESHVWGIVAGEQGTVSPPIGISGRTHYYVISSATEFAISSFTDRFFDPVQFFDLPDGGTWPTANDAIFASGSSWIQSINGIIANLEWVDNVPPPDPADNLFTASPLFFDVNDGDLLESFQATIGSTFLASDHTETGAIYQVRWQSLAGRVDPTYFQTVAIHAYETGVIRVDGNGLFGPNAPGVELSLTAHNPNVSVNEVIDIDAVSFTLTTKDVVINEGHIEFIDAASFTLTTLDGTVNEVVGVDTASFTLVTYDVIVNAREIVLIDAASFAVVTQDANINEAEIIEIDAASFALTTLEAGVGDVVPVNFKAFVLVPGDFLVNDIVGTDPLTFTLNALDVQANAKDIVLIDAASFTLVAQEANTIADDFVGIVPAASFTLTTNTFLVNDVIGIDVVNFTLTTNAPSIDVDIIPGAASLNLTTHEANVKLPINLDATDAIVLTTLVAGVNDVIGVDVASFTLATQDVVVNAREVVTIDAAAFTLTTILAGVDESIIPDAASFTVTTYESRVNNSELIFIDLATLTLTAQAAGVNEIVPIDSAAFNLQTADAVINEQERIATDAASFSLSPQSVTLNAEYIVFVDTLLVQLTTNDARINEQFIVEVDTASLAITALITNVRELQNIPLTQFSLAGQDVVINEGEIIFIDNTVAFTLTTYVGGVNEIIPVDQTVFGLVGLDVIVNERYIEPIALQTFVLVDNKPFVNDVIGIDLVTFTLTADDTDFDSTFESFVGQFTEFGWELVSADIGTTQATLVAKISTTTSAAALIDTRAEASWSIPVVEFN